MNDKHKESRHSHDGMSMTCRELFERLSEYVDGELSRSCARRSESTWTAATRA